MSAFVYSAFSGSFRRRTLFLSTPAAITSFDVKRGTGNLTTAVDHHKMTSYGTDNVVTFSSSSTRTVIVFAS